MILWLNGAFGVGKTSTAALLCDRIPGSFLCDPEEIGGALRRSVPDAADFQDIPLWRTFIRQTLRYVTQQSPGRVIVVPMTLVNETYHREIVGGLREDGILLQHYTLLASPTTLRQRLNQRGDGPESWSAQQIERCVPALSAPEFAHHIDTEVRTIAQIVEDILARINYP